MPDNKLQKGPQDSARININEDYEVRYWTEKFNCSKQKLKEAVGAVGFNPSKVNTYLKKSKTEKLTVRVQTKTNVKIDVKKLRRDFPMLASKPGGKPMIYFDSAATTHKPKVVIEKLKEYYLKQYAKPNEQHSFSKTTTVAVELTRRKTAKFIGASSPKQIIFTRGTTEGTNIVAHGFADAILNMADEILITKMEHHSNIIPWQMACVKSGAVLRTISITGKGEIDLNELDSMITGKTRIISIPHSSHVLGTILPIKKICALAHAKGVAVMVDGAQAAPHMPVSMKDLGCDFYAFSCHKMGGPTGLGVLYGKTEWLNKIAPLIGGAEMADTVTFSSSTYTGIPKKFEGGTPPFAEIIAFGTLIDYTKKINLANTSQYEVQLLKQATEGLSKIKNVRIFGTSDNKEPLISFDIEGKDVKKLERYLHNKWGIALRAGELTAQPLMKVLGVKQLIRASFCYYNTPQEVETLIKGVETFAKMK
ncbi:MAG: cysteine desulfurase [Bacteroidetes bacterium]|nr:cysteine desulfurase [Bacteroidota bacterium]